MSPTPSGSTACARRASADASSGAGPDVSQTLPARRRAALGFILVTAVLDVLAIGIVIPVLPALIESFAGSNAQAGLINGVFLAMFAVMQFFCSPVIGSLSDRYGRRPVLLISSAGLAADYVLMAMAPNLWWLALGRLIAGVTAASFGTISAYMADITLPEQRARAYGLVGAAFSGGFVAGPLLGGVLGEVSPRAPFWVAGALGALSFIYGACVLPESLPPERRMAFAWRRASPRGALALLGRSHELSVLAIVHFLLHFAHYVFATIFVLYAAERYGWHAWEVGVVFGVFGVLDMLVQGLLVERAVKRFGERGTLAIGLFGGVIGVAGMGLASTGELFWLAMLPNALWGLAMPTLQSLMTRRVTESEQGQLQGASASVASIAGMLAPMFFGAVYSVSVGDRPLLPTPGAPLLIASGVLLLAAVLAAMVLRGDADGIEPGEAPGQAPARAEEDPQGTGSAS